MIEVLSAREREGETRERRREMPSPNSFVRSIQYSPETMALGPGPGSNEGPPGPDYWPGNHFSREMDLNAFVQRVVDEPLKKFLFEGQLATVKYKNNQHLVDGLQDKLKIRLNGYACELVDIFSGLDKAQIKLHHECLESTPEFIQVI
jgi:hypothetical protein